ncbi:MAG: hypothetical protein AB7C97_12865 [Oscillospiraceae bacterium]
MRFETAGEKTERKTARVFENETRVIYCNMDLKTIPRFVKAQMFLTGRRNPRITDYSYPALLIDYSAGEQQGCGTHSRRNNVWRHIP